MLIKLYSDDKYSKMKRLFSLIMSFCAVCLSNAANYLTFTAEEAGSKFGIYNSEDNDPDVQYSLDDGATWTVLKPGDRVELKNIGDKALLKGNNPDGFSMSFEHDREYFYDYTEFRMTGKIAASGSVMSLVDGDKPSTIIPSNGCFYRLFSGCTALTKAPELPATTLRNQCYQQMFYDCTSLTKAPKLPATKLFPGCYMFMFYFCENLTEVPELPATEFFDEYSGDPSRFLPCYGGMFGKCRSLKKITVNLSDWGELYEAIKGELDSNTDGWVTDVASSGTFICPKALTVKYGEDRIPEGWTIKSIEDEYPNYLTFTAEEAGSTFGIGKTYEEMTENFDFDLQYSLDDGVSWINLRDGDIVTLRDSGDKALLRGVNPEGLSNGYYKFVMSGKIFASGSVMSIVDGCGRSVVIPGEACFANLFKNCLSLTHAPELPATTLRTSCYAKMFYGCKNLREAPKLPSMKMAGACYSEMFANCTSLTQAPELPALLLANDCYISMFEFCKSLTKAPKLPAGIMADFCYLQMFAYCTNLTEAPELPATRLANLCYCEMFYECSKLKRAPKLPATTLSDNCYSNMFVNCDSLTQAPELPATTLADKCYYNMFLSCDGLTEAPELPATTLADYCYYNMFNSCSNLSKIKLNITEWDFESSTTGWVKDVAPTGTFICPKALAEEYGKDRIPEGWTIKYIDENTGVNDAVSSEIAVWTEGNTIYVRGAEGDVTLYDVYGRLISTSAAKADEIHMFNVPAKGVYLVGTNGETVTTLVR